MTSQTSRKPRTWQRALCSGLLAGAMALGATSAVAGECPASQRVADGQGQPPGPDMPRGVTDTVLATTDLALEPVAVDGRLFRIRRLDMQPGAIVPWHSHDDRPAMIYVVTGEVIEYAGNCRVPIVHRAGEVSAETRGVSHWWENSSAHPAVLISADLFPTGVAMNEHEM